MQLSAKAIMAQLNTYEDPIKADFLQRFFKTGKGQYAEGDIFIGLNVPTTRKVVKNFINLPLGELEILLDSPIHEHRLASLIIMVSKAKREDEANLKKLYKLYLRRTDRINNWDLVDTSCREIVGVYLQDKSKAPLYKLAKSNSLWERRIAIVSTGQFIKHNQLEDTFKISELLIKDQQDLIHKAVGWMLREAGKKDPKSLINFLDKNAKILPRTALRYSLERLSVSDKQYYMKLA